MGSEWGREQLKLLKKTYEEYEMDMEGPDYKKRVAAIMKIDLKKLQQQAAGVKKARAAAEKVKLVWGATLVEGWDASLTWEDVKEKLTEVYEGTWRVDTSCPNTKAAGKLPARRYVVKDDDGGIAYVRVVKEDNGTYYVQEGVPKEAAEAEDEEGGEEEPDGKKNKTPAGGAASAPAAPDGKKRSRGKAADVVQPPPAEADEPPKRGGRGDKKKRGK